MSTEENKALIRRFYEAVFNNRNLTALDEFYAPNHIDHTLPPGLPIGPEGTKQAARNAWGNPTNWETGGGHNHRNHPHRR